MYYSLTTPLEESFVASCNNLSFLHCTSFPKNHY